MLMSQVMHVPCKVDLVLDGADFCWWTDSGLLDNNRSCNV